jgi:hypothetical protein
VLPAVQLNNQPSSLTAEIDNIFVDRHLAAKLETAQTAITQFEP